MGTSFPQQNAEPFAAKALPTESLCSLSIDRSRQFTAANSESLDGTGALMSDGNVSRFWSAWIYFPSGANRGVFGKFGASSADQYFYIALNASRNLVVVLIDTGGTQRSLTSASAMAVDTWHLIQVQLDRAGNNLHIYINDPTSADASLNVSAWTFKGGTTQIAQVGAVRPGIWHWEGRIQQPIYYVGLTTQAERLEIWNGGSGQDQSRFASFVPTNSWRGNEESGGETAVQGAVNLTDTNTVTNADGHFSTCQT